MGAADFKTIVGQFCDEAESFGAEEILKQFKGRILPHISGSSNQEGTKSPVRMLINCLEQRQDKIIDKKELYLILAICYDYLWKRKEAIQLLKKALDIDANFTQAMLNLGRIQRKTGELQNAITTFSDGIDLLELDDKERCKFLNSRGNVFFDLSELVQAKSDFEAAIKLESNNPKYHLGLGSLEVKQENYTAAVTHYQNAIDADPTFSNAYLMKAIALYEAKEVIEARKVLDEVSMRQPQSQIVHLNYGNFLEREGDLDGAARKFEQATQVDPTYAFAYLKLGIILVQKGQLDKAINAYQDFVKRSDSVFAKGRAKHRIQELKARNTSNTYALISNCIDDIEEALKYDGKAVTHYTSLDTARLLVLHGSKLRMSEASFMNDSSEGAELFSYLGINFEDQPTTAVANSTFRHETEFVKKPFIGSFVPEDMSNDLLMWRFYGKDSKDEANGCSITINVIQLQDTLVNQLVPNADSAEKALRKEEVQFFRVAYFHNDQLWQTDDINYSGLQGVLERLKGLLSKKFNSLTSDLQNMVKLRLAKLAIFFKSAAYRHEREVRLAFSEIGFKVKIDAKMQVPRAYIDVIPLNTCLKRITLGPKASRPREWNAAFRYHLDNNFLERVEVKVSALPHR
ncbi:MAG: tetratricopeptide repeat protein [Bacteroidota bacterium]